jgi:hypothetical protein
VVYVALLLAALVLRFYVGGPWLAPAFGLAAMHFLLHQRGAEGGLLDLFESAWPLWACAILLGLLVLQGPPVPAA